MVKVSADCNICTEMIGGTGNTLLLSSGNNRLLPVPSEKLSGLVEILPSVSEYQLTRIDSTSLTLAPSSLIWTTREGLAEVRLER